MFNPGYRRKFNAAIVILTLCLCVGVIAFVKERTDNTLPASTLPRSSTVIILDAGHGECALSVVI